jgi:hypothetical protein
MKGAQLFNIIKLQEHLFIVKRQVLEAEANPIKHFTAVIYGFLL